MAASVDWIYPEEQTGWQSRQKEHKNDYRLCKGQEKLQKTGSMMVVCRTEVSIFMVIWTKFFAIKRNKVKLTMTANADYFY